MGTALRAAVAVLFAASAWAAKPLPYELRSLLDAQRSNLNAAESYHKSALKEADPARKTSLIKQAKTKLSYIDAAVEKKLAALEAHPDGEAFLNRYGGLKEKLDAAERADGAERGARSAQDAKTFAGFEEDYEALRALNGRYTDAMAGFKSPAEARDIVANLDANREIQRRIVALYENDKNPKRAKMAGVVSASKRTFPEMEKFLEDRKASLADEIRSDLDKTMAKAKQGVAEKKPLFFKHGIPGMLDLLKPKLELYEALAGKDDAKAAAFKKEYGDKLIEIDAMALALGESELAAVTVPSDGYRGGDRAKLLGLARAEWERSYPGDKILALRIPAAAWERKDERRWNEHSGWYALNHSVLQVLVIVRKDDRLATIYPVEFLKDHAAGDKLSVDAGARAVPMMGRDILQSKLGL